MQFGDCLDADPEDPFQALRLRLIEARRSPDAGSSLLALAARRTPLPRLAGVTRARCLARRRKQPVKTGQVDPRFGHQGRQPGDEIEGFKDDVRRAVSVRRLQSVADVAVRRERQRGKPASLIRCVAMQR
jgi:hypothetical protein